MARAVDAEVPAGGRAGLAQRPELDDASAAAAHVVDRPGQVDDVPAVIDGYFVPEDRRAHSGSLLEGTAARLVRRFVQRLPHRGQRCWVSWCPAGSSQVWVRSRARCATGSYVAAQVLRGSPAIGYLRLEPRLAHPAGAL